MTLTSEVRRILVALDDSQASQAALNAAVELAERLGAELEGVFVQDLELLKLAELGLARETGLASASRRSLDSAGIERAWRVQASRVKAALDAAAARHRVRSSFRVARGDVTGELLQAAASADLIALGTMGQMAITGRRVGSTVRGVTRQASCSVLLSCYSPAAAKRVLVLYAESEAGDRALAWAERFHESRGGDLLVLMAPASDAERQRAEERVRSIAGADVQTVSGDDLAARVKESDCQLVIVPHDSPLLEDADGLLTGLGVPVLVAR